DSGVDVGVVRIERVDRQYVESEEVIGNRQVERPRKSGDARNFGKLVDAGRKAEVERFAHDFVPQEEKVVAPETERRAQHRLQALELVGRVDFRVVLGLLRDFLE